jgi:stage II sporulation protein D
MVTALVCVMVCAMICAGASPSDAAVADSVSVQVLSRLQPAQLEIASPASPGVVPYGEHVSLSLYAAADRLYINGEETEQPWRAGQGRWRVDVPGHDSRFYRGSLAARARDDEVVLVVTMDLEEYVARVVASETVPGTPQQALNALAVVVRSYALAGDERHPHARVCDLAHCQVLKGRGEGTDLRSARLAAKLTRGQVLVVDDTRVAQATFHAACGGHTADPEAVFGGMNYVGAHGVADTECPPCAWQVELEHATVEEALRVAFAACEATYPRAPSDAPGYPPPSLVDIDFVRGGDGRVVQLVHRPSGQRCAGDRFVRVLDGMLDWGVVRSARLWIDATPARVRIHGRGVGHGVGLCQAGAMSRARLGFDYQAILQHYFPAARLSSLDRAWRISRGHNQS